MTKWLRLDRTWDDFPLVLCSVRSYSMEHSKTLITGLVKEIHESLAHHGS